MRRLFLFLLLVGFFNPTRGQTKCFTFAWLSDTHVGSTTGAEDLRASVQDINAIDSISFVILSGDITELGWNAEIELAKQILDSLNKPYYILPGNHDTKWSESGCVKFSQIFGADRFVFSFHGYRFVGLHEGPVMRMGDGHFAPEDLRWFDSVFAHSPDKRQPLFFVTHYPLDPQLDNWYEMTDRLKKLNIKAVLVGHGHSNRKLDFEGIPGIMGRSNLRANRPRGGFTLVRMGRDSTWFFERIAGRETRPPWCAISLRDRDSLADTPAYPRPDFSVNQKYPNVQRVWTVQTGYTIASAPAVSGGSVVVGNSSGFVHCYSLKSGAEQWRFKTGATVYSTADISDGKIVVGSSDGNIYCLNLVDGRLKWKFQIGSAIVACPRVDGEFVYIGGSDGKFRSLHFSDGTLNWEFSDVGAFIETKPLVYENKVVFGAWDSYLYALNIENGSLSWKWSNGSSARGLSPAAVWPVASNGKIFVAAPDRAMTALDAKTGREVWRTKAHQVREAVGISEDGSRVFAKCMNDTLFAFSTEADSAKLAWATDCGYGYDIDPSMPQEKDGTVFFGHKNGTVFALDSKTGALKWQYKIGNTIVNTVAPIDGRRVIVTDFDGKIVMLEEAGKK
jgi:outer membrane protein assembly factor BamB/predicted phosphohydrolase